jgi:hypothetical protein
MQNIVKISSTIGTTDPAAGLGVEIWLDGQQIFNQDSVTEDYNFVYELNDADAEHELCFVMKNKTQLHTKIDNDGNIVKDACITVSNLSFDEIALGHVFVEKSVYVHDFNGSGEKTQNKFYGTMGCNGSVNFKFYSPIYLWLLENM